MSFLSNGMYPVTYSEFRTYYLAHESWVDDTQESADMMHKIEQDYPAWYQQLMSETV